MTAYAAVVSLKNTIEHILLSSHISLIDPSIRITKLVYKELQPLQEILERLDSTSKSRSRKKVNALDARIKEAVWRFEYLLESLLSDQINSQSGMPQSQGKLTIDIHRRRRLLCEGEGELESYLSGLLLLRLPRRGSPDRTVLSFIIDLQSLQDDVDPFIQTIKDLEKEYNFELENMPQDDESTLSKTCFGGMKSKMIGLSDQFEQVKHNLTQQHSTNNVYALFGMAGVGKTSLAREIFEDPSTSRHFKCRAWVTVGRKPQLDQVSRDIRAQLCEDDHSPKKGLLEKVGDYLKEKWEGKKFLVVLDDVWELRVLDSLLCSLPDMKMGTVQVLLTARDRSVTIGINLHIWDCSDIVVRLLNEKESKDLLYEKVFGTEICPPRLDKAAAKIAKNCEGLPLMIVTVARHLSQAQNEEPEYWNDVAEERNSVFMDAYNEISEVLFPTYDYLPQHLKMLLLYMGVFPRDYDIPPSKITNMLTAEGYLERNTNVSSEDCVWRYMEELREYHNLVLSNLKSIFLNGGSGSCMYKSCRLHSSWLHLCRGEAQKNKFSHVLNRLVCGSEQAIKGQRCLCFQNNILFGIKEFCSLVRCNCASSTRSLLFFGPYHKYPFPIDADLKLLRVLDALKLRFYVFPVEILILVQLRYLALTCDEELPSAISRLFNLRVLIIHPHINIKSCGAPLDRSIETWDMQELDHVEMFGNSLSRINASTWKLGVRIELAPDYDDKDLFRCFDHISKYTNYGTLKCSIINAEIQYGYFPITPPSSFKFPKGLQKLHLSGMGFPWEYMDVIGSLPYLLALKLRSHAFQGPKWEPEAESFLCLRFLLIEDNDLVQWKPGSGSFPELNYLSLKHCYELEELHWPSAVEGGKIELVDCNPLAFTNAKKLRLKGNKSLVVTASSSFT